MALPLSALDEPGLRAMLADGSAVDTTCKPRPGGQPEPKAKKKKKGRKKELLPNVCGLIDGKVVFVVGVATASESNIPGWHGKNGRTQAARLAISKAFGPHLRALAPIAEHYHRGQPIRVVLTRIGGGKLDKSNLPHSLKGTEDAVEMMLGADDGDEKWLVEFAQEPNTPGGMGVRIELERA